MTPKLTLYHSNPDGSFKLFSRAPEYPCGQMIAQGSMTRTMPYVRVGVRHLSLPIVGNQLGKLEVCDRCINQMSCLAGDNEGAVLTPNDLAQKAGDS